MSSCMTSSMSVSCFCRLVKFQSCVMSKSCINWLLWHKHPFIQETPFLHTREVHLQTQRSNWRGAPSTGPFQKSATEKGMRTLEMGGYLLIVLIHSMPIRFCQLLRHILGTRRIYDSAHQRSHCMEERAIGIWKMRFHMLPQVIRNSKEVLFNNRMFLKERGRKHYMSPSFSSTI